MKKIKLIINSSSGRQRIEPRIEQLKDELAGEYILDEYFTKGEEDTIFESKKASLEGYDLIVSFGGDGTVNQVVQGIHESQVDTPLAVYPSGTVNDLANYLHMPKDIKEFANLIRAFKIEKMDYGMANDRAFINVAAGGLLTDVAMTVSDELKSIFGRAAYYFEGVKNFIKNMIIDKYSINLKLESEEVNFEGPIMLFIIGNTTSVGGFNKMVPDADVNDGKLDVLVIKECELNNLAGIFLGVLTGSHINDENVIYFHTDRVVMSSSDVITVDIDGETGDELPVEFSIRNNGISILRV